MSLTASVPKAQVVVRQSANGRGEFVTIRCVPGTTGVYDGPKLGFRTRVKVILGKGSLLILPPEDDDYVIDSVDTPRRSPADTTRKSILDIHGSRVTIERCSPDVALGWKGREAELVGGRLAFKANGRPLQAPQQPDMQLGA